MNQDEEHLKLLSIFHYVVGGILGFVACIPLLHFTIGMVMLAGAIDGVPAFVGLMLVMMSLFFMAIGWTLAVCLIIAGSFLAQRRHYTFCFVVACISCLLMPYGTVLGVFTIIVLMRPSVKNLFAVSP
jgi:hypothetical protein